MADDGSYLTFCAHCENHLPARTFRNHRERFYDPINNRWENDISVLDSNSDDETSYMEIDPNNIHDDIQDSADRHNVNTNSANIEDLIDQEVWDEAMLHDIDEDFRENSEALPSIGVNHVSRSRSFNVAFVRCLIILLAYFWTYFRISDSAMEFLLCCFKKVFEIAALSSNWLTGLALTFPGTLYLFRKELGFEKDKFTKYVVCPKCHALYNFENCYKTVGSNNESKKCSFVKFPNHRQRWRRQPCGSVLLKEVTLKHGAKRLYPHKVYCYQSVIETLKTFVKRAHFTERCELWRNRETRSIGQIMCDVFDGRVWRDFQLYEGNPFLAAPRNYAFMLNVDWMQPFERTIYSIGVIYLVLMNLPRSERFKRQNVILVGIIPGPNEPPLNINTYLSPLVDELLILWNDGVNICHDGSQIYPDCFRAALLCVACDIPASRKVCGFFGHQSRNGCNKCTKTFITGGIGAPTDYSGFESCTPRNIIEHRRQIAEILDQTTQELRNASESSYGVRYSELLRLPYFDCVRFNVVDPMHNLFLGTAKHLMEIWLDSSILTAADLRQAQEKVDASRVPSDLGRIPSKIAKLFAGFTAEQWKTWVTVFSTFALFNCLPDNDYRCWLHFVNACTILCSPMIKPVDVGAAHSFLLRFCRGFEEKYGKSRVTPNMHMHTHLAESILDYGPIYSFWLFSFERYNGILGNYYTNNKSVELQVMRKFIRDQDLRNLELPENFKEQLQPLVDKLQHSQTNNDEKDMVEREKVLRLLKLTYGQIDITDDLWYSVDSFTLGSPHVIDSFDDDEIQYITDVYKVFFPDVSVQNVPRLYDKYASAECAGERYGSQFSRLNRCSFILAKWADRFDGNINIEAIADLRPAVVLYFVKQTVHVGLRKCTFCFARVNWFQYHPNRFLCGPSGVTPEVWCANLFDSFGPASFLPVQRVHGKFVAGYDTVNGENVLFVLPLAKKQYV